MLYSNGSLTRKIPKESCSTFFRGRSVIVQGVPTNTDTDYADHDILEWIELEADILAQKAARLSKKDGDSKPQLIKITSPSSRMAAATLEASRADRRRLPSGIRMHRDRPHDAIQLTLFLPIKS
ncbi:unnamed protein product [Schistosoma curassoni]|nr:unnamed protein product [Schistosoma curassoni]